MTLLDYFLLHPALTIVVAALFGLTIGSFLNVVIARLPQMMEREWREQCLALQNIPVHSEAMGLAAAAPHMADAATATPEPRYNLAVPRSHCPACKHQLAWWENLPLVSWMALRGKCSHCKTPISARYPVVELLTAALFAACAAVFGPSLMALAAAGFCAALVALAFIDADTGLLPDDITLPLLWAGLLVNIVGTFVPLVSAVVGAMVGYLSLWLIYWGFRLVTGKEGMGFGDFKLLAAIGAWLGWQALPVVVVLSSVVGVIGGGALMLSGRAERGQALPFGPYLAGAGVLALLWRDGWQQLLWPAM